MNKIVQEIRDELTKLKGISAEQARSMPPTYYTSADFLALEEEHIFHKEWICVGHTGEIPNPGDYYVTELVGEPLIVTHSHDGQIRVLSNVCRHRGNLLAEESGNRKNFICAYHAWVYNSEGHLQNAPMMDRVEGFDKSACRLPSFATEIWEGFIYVNLDGSAASATLSMARRRSGPATGRRWPKTLWKATISAQLTPKRSIPLPPHPSASRCPTMITTQAIGPSIILTTLNVCPTHPG